MKNRETNVTGGLSIIIEGASEKLVAQLTDAVIKKLSTSGKSTLADTELRNPDENILAANQRLLDATGGRLSPSTLSLLIVIKLQQRLKRIQKAKADGKYVVSNLSWLSDAAYYESKGAGSVVDQILVDCGLIRPDVWVIIDEPHGIYARTAKKAGVRVYSPKLKISALIDAVMEHIGYAEKKKPVEPKKIENLEPKPTTKTDEQKPEPKPHQSLVSQLALLQILETEEEKHIRPNIYEKSDRQSVYFSPELPEKVLKAYDTLMNKLYDNYAAAVPLVSQYVSANGTPKDASVEAARNVVRGILPLASLQQVSTIKPLKLESTSLKELEQFLQKGKKTAGISTDLSDELLPNNYDADTESGAILASAYPRNELELLGSIMFESSESSLKHLRNHVSDLSGEDKQRVFETYARESTDRRALRDAKYVWDLLTEVDVYEASVASLPMHSTQHQPFSPRYGYDIPAIAEEAGVLDIYQQSFDLSLELYNLLAAAGHPIEAQYAVLNGHRVRWKLSLNGEELRNFIRSGSSPRLGAIRDQLPLTVGEVHPLTRQLL